jgi:hypothetical protein
VTVKPDPHPRSPPCSRALRTGDAGNRCLTGPSVKKIERPQSPWRLRPFPSLMEGWWGRGSMIPGSGGVMMKATHSKTASTQATHGKGGLSPSPGTAVALPPQSHDSAPPSLEFFHPRRQRPPPATTKLTRREALHFISTTIAAEEDRSEDKKGRRPMERIWDTTSLEASLYRHQAVCCERLRALQSAIHGYKGLRGTSLASL